MRQIHLNFSLCIVMLLSMVTMADAAGRIMVNADNGLAGTTISLEVQDAEITSVIAAIFNAADNKYQVRIGNGVTGMIDELLIDNQPFDIALDEILKKVNADYSFTKLSPTSYRIKAPAEAIVAPITVMAMPTKVDDSLRMIKAMLPPMKKSTTATTPDVTMPGEEVTPVEEPTAEEAILAVLKIRYIDVPSLCDALGYEYMESFNSNQNNNNGGTYNNSRNNRNNNNNNSYYDENGNLINNNNNNNNVRYDANGRIINDNNNVRYDANGRIINDNNNVRYDANGRVINDNNVRYDANGRIIN